MFVIGSIGEVIGLIPVGCVVLMLPLSVAYSADLSAEKNSKLKESDRPLFATFWLIALLAIPGFCIVLAAYAPTLGVIVYAVVGVCVAFLSWTGMATAWEGYSADRTH